VLAGDFAHPHAPEDRIVSLGPVDDTVRRSLLQSTLAVLQCDSRLHLPVSLIEAWSLGRPTLVTDPHPALRQATRRWASEYVCESYAFASCLAALLSRRAPRAALAARTRSHARRSYEPGLVVAGLESCVEALRAPIAS
jgi:glycosyltransferase involved in cell wall biosynthesis